MTTMTYQQFEQEYHDIKSICRSYRLGQHFINRFVEGDTSHLCLMWNEVSFEAARNLVSTYIVENKLDWNGLVLLVDEPFTL